MQLFKKRDGYTLMELLVVIAIIGVLAGLIFPVAATAKQRAKQAQCMNNMYQIFTALKQFQLDERKYPEFIAGPVQWKDPSTGKYVYSGGDMYGVPLGMNTGMVGGTNGGNGRAVALYPEYINDPRVLHCPIADMNAEKPEYRQYSQEVKVSNAESATAVADPMYVRLASIPIGRRPWRGKGLQAADPSITSSSALYVYKYSSYDYQKPLGCNPDPAQADEIHYSPAWADCDPASGAPVPDVQRQLRWKTPPEDTVITWCSHHRRITSVGFAGGSKDIVLFLDGHTTLVASEDMEPWDAQVGAVKATGWRIPR